MEIRDLFEKSFKENEIMVSVDDYFKGVYSPGNIINSYGTATATNALQIEIHKIIRKSKSEKSPKVIDGIVKGALLALEILNKT